MFVSELSILEKRNLIFLSDCLEVTFENWSNVAIVIDSYGNDCVRCVTQRRKMMKNFYHLRSHQMMQGIGIIIVALTIMAGCASIPEPTEQMALSKNAVNNAISEGANEFAPVQLRSAMDKMDAAERAVAEEEYEDAKQLAEQAQVDAQLATSMARAGKAQKTVRELEEGNRTLQQEIERKAQ
jgi:hypothetical protein